MSEAPPSGWFNVQFYCNDGANTVDTVDVIDSLDADGFTLDVTVAPAGAYL